MLYNVLIVDDEPLIRMGLRLSVPWETLGFKVIAEAGTAKEAMEKLEQCSVHLALVDIQMPGTNGIEFIREMRSRFPHIKSLIISGHGDFEYTVSALKLEVCDYLLKPIDMEKLVEAVKNVRERIEQDARSVRVMHGQRAIAGKMMVLKLLGKDFKNREEINEYCSQCGIVFPLENYCAVTMKVHKFIQMIEDHYQGQRTIFESDFDDELYRNIPNPENVFSALVGDYYTVLAETGLVDAVRSILYQKAKSEGLQVRIGTGEAFKDIFFMDVSYLQANENIKKRESAITGDKASEGSRLSYMTDQMIQKLDERKFDEARDLAQSIFVDNLSVDTGIVLNWCISSIYSIVDYFQLTSYEEMKDIVTFEIQTISNLYFWTTMRSVYYEKIDKICRFLEGLQGSSNEVIVNKVCNIVKKAYSDPELSLQKISGELGISYNYLSTIFKQISGENFSGYLTKVKMNHAKHLLMEGKLKMYEIAEKVGYVNAKYFAEQFKKTVGMTTSEYKSLHNSKKRSETDGISI